MGLGVETLSLTKFENEFCTYFIWGTRAHMQWQARLRGALRALVSEIMVSPHWGVGHIVMYAFLKS